LFGTLFKERYSFELIKVMVMATFSGVFIANLLAPVLASYAVYKYVNTELLLEWFLAHILLLILRIVNGKKMLSLIKQESNYVYFYLRISYVLNFLTALLFGALIWYAVVDGIEDILIVVLSVVVFSLASSSIATLGAVFTGYFIFIVSNFLFLVSALFYHGGELFSVFALIMTILLTTLVRAGYKQYVFIKDSIAMDETFKNIYYGSSDGLVISEGGQFVSCNNAILKMFKIPSMELFLRSDLSRFSPEKQPDGRSSMEKMALLTGKAYVDGSTSFEWLHHDYYGNEFWCEVVLTKIHLKGKDLLHGVWRDISERKAMNEAAILHKQEIEKLNSSLESRVKEEVRKNLQKDRQLLQQSRLAQMGEMISMIAHQWRQPLTAISSTSAAIGLKASLGKLESQSAVELSGKISTYVQHLSETIDDFRSFFKQNREKVETNYNQIVESVLHIIDMSIASKKITLIQELNCDATFLTYQNELKQVILNLLKNAEDVLAENNVKDPFIKIKSYTDGRKAILEVSDNGGGISEDVMDKIFDPYFSTKLKKDGTGLGLYMSKIIVEEHCHGALVCKNIDNGVTCIMEIPIA